MGAVLLDTLLACGHWAPRCLLHTLGAEERAPDRPWDSERPCPRGAAATTNPTSQLSRPQQTWCWGAQAGRAGALAPTPARGPRLPWPGPEGSEDLWVSQCPALPGAAARPSTHLGASPRSAPAAPAAGRRPRTPGPSPAPRAPPWVPPPLLSGPKLSRGSARPRPQWPRAGVRATPGAAGRCAHGPPWGPEPRTARRAERPGGGAAGRGGARGALRLSRGVRRLFAPWREPAEEEPGQGCPRALARAPRLPASASTARAEAWTGASARG